MPTQKIAADILGYIVTVICLVSPQFKRKWQMLSCTFVANFISGTQFLLLGQVSAVGVSAVAILQSAAGIRHSLRNTKSGTLENIFFSLLYIAGGLFPFVITGTLAEFTLLDVLPILGALLLMCSMVPKNEQIIRLFGLANCGVFVVYDAIIQSTQIFAQFVSIASLSIALFRYRKKKPL